MVQHRVSNLQDTNAFMPLFLLAIILMNIHQT